MSEMHFQPVLCPAMYGEQRGTIQIHALYIKKKSGGRPKPIVLTMQRLDGIIWKLINC